MSTKRLSAISIGLLSVQATEKQYVIGVDIGTASARAGVFDLHLRGLRGGTSLPKELTAEGIFQMPLRL